MQQTKRVSDNSRHRARGGAATTFRRCAALAVFALTLALVGASNALAISEICGDGVDNDGSGGDALCPAPDQDRDGYFSNGLGPNSGTDCDDTDRTVYPGNGGRYSSAGCSAGQYKTCQSDGSFSACANLSSFTCHSGSGSTYWFSTTGNNSTGNGSYANPWADYRCISESALGCYHSPIAGDCFVFRAGTYNASWSDAGTTRMLYFNNKDGNSTDKITITEAPGESVTIQGIGVSPTQVWPAYFVDSNFIQWFGINITGGYSTNGLWDSGGTDWEVANAKFYDMRGKCGTDNCGGMKFTGNAHRPYIHHTTAYDIYDSSDLTNDNNHNVLIMDVDAPRYNDNVCYDTDGAKGSACYSIKHRFSGGSAETLRNVFFNTRRSCIWTEQPNHTIRYNYMEACNQNNGSGGAIQYSAVGTSTPEYDDMLLEYNTLVDTPFMDLFSTEVVIGSGLIITARYNVVRDNRATGYPGDGTDGFLRIGYYGSDSQYTSVVGGNKLVFDYNCYYNSAGTALWFTLFGATSSGYGPAGASNGANYTSFAAWQGTGLDANSVNDNPDFDAYGRVTNTSSCSTGWGWNAYINSTGGGGPACILMRMR